MRKCFRKPFVIVLVILLCGVLFLLLKRLERYHFTAIAESANQDQSVSVKLNCTIWDSLLHDEKKIYGSVQIRFENGKEIEYEFLKAMTNFTEDIYMAPIAGVHGINSSEYGFTVPTGFWYFEDEMNTFMLSQIHPYLGDFVGVKDGEVTDEIIKKYEESMFSQIE